jgi:hypothetical protein
MSLIFDFDAFALAQIPDFIKVVGDLLGYQNEPQRHGVHRAKFGRDERFF